MIQDFINGLEDPDGKLNGFGMKILIINLILNDYKECPNVVETDNNLPFLYFLFHHHILSSLDKMQRVIQML